MRRFLDLMLVLLAAQVVFAAEPPRARDLGIPF